MSPVCGKALKCRLFGFRRAQMSTGEGKTLVATLPAYLNALEGKGVYVVTVNDFLAERDAAEYAPARAPARVAFLSFYFLC